MKRAHICRNKQLAGFIFRFVRELGYQFEFQEDSSCHSQLLSVKMSTTNFSTDYGRHKVCADFVNSVLLGRIASSLKAAEKDALSASKHNPTHGICILFSLRKIPVGGNLLVALIQATALCFFFSFFNIQVNFVQ